jgi:hypothetical protein
MRKLVTGECNDQNVFHLVDPTTFVEVDFEAEVVKAFTCLQPDYWCGIFAGSFVLEGDRRRADLALIHKKLSHWFVVEVELAGHSFEDHVLPQVRCFRYGDPDQSCVTSLVRAFSALSEEQAASLLSHIPRHVAVISNLPNREWHNALRAIDTQYLTVSIYRNHEGRHAHEIEGQLVANKESLGFARYSAVHNCLRISSGCGLGVGQVQIFDQFGIPAVWSIREESGVLWISKEQGPTLLAHESYVQIMRTIGGQVSLRPSSSGR